LSWEEEEQERSFTRREWVRMGVAAGTVGVLGALGAPSIGQLLPPPRRYEGELRDEIYYTKWPEDTWWNRLAGQPVRVTDFDEEWRGATGVWRALFRDRRLVLGPGFPVLIIRIKRDVEAFEEPLPSEVPPLPEGYSLYYDDEARDIRIVVCFDKCVHFCCTPGWHVVTDPPPGRDYLAGEPPPTWAKYGVDPIYCICHGSQYEPMQLVVNVNDKERVRYVGARHVHGPATRALPIIPVRAVNDVLVGGMPDSRWYVYC